MSYSADSWHKHNNNKTIFTNKHFKWFEWLFVLFELNTCVRVCIIYFIGLLFHWMEIHSYMMYVTHILCKSSYNLLISLARYFLNNRFCLCWIKFYDVHKWNGHEYLPYVKKSLSAFCCCCRCCGIAGCLFLSFFGPCYYLSFVYCVRFLKKKYPNSGHHSSPFHSNQTIKQK